MIPQNQAEINQVLNKYFEEPVRSNRKKLGLLSATERLRDLNIQLQNMLFADRSKLRLALNNESLILKPVRSQKQIITTRGNVETHLGMIELAFALPFGSEDSMTTINFVNAQLDVDESVYAYACEQD